MGTDDSERSRRSFIATAALGTTLGVAGCSGDFSLSDDSGSDSESDDEETETEGGDDGGVAAAEVSGEYTLEEGDGTDPQSRGLAKPVTFEGDSGDTVSITMTSDAFDTYLMLEGPDGDVVTEDDDGAGGLNSQILWTLEQSGEYTIWCGSFSTNSTGPFNLDVQELGDSSGAASISYGQSQQYVLQEGDGIDPSGRGLAKPVTFEGESGDTVTISMTSEFDTYLILADPDGDVVTEDDDGGFGLDSEITWTLGQSGEYTIWCGSYSTRSTGTFTLELQQIAEAGTGDAGSISYGQSQQYVLQEGDGIDPRGRGLAKPVTFLGDSGDTVTISMNSEFDTYLILAGPDGNILTEDDDGGYGLNSEITWTLGQSGEYTIWCGSYSTRSTGTFTLELQRT